LLLSLLIALQKSVIYFHIAVSIYNNDNIWRRNKLRTYRKLKANFEAEKYLYTDVDKCSISTFVRVRISNCNLDWLGEYYKLCFNVWFKSYIFFTPKIQILQMSKSLLLKIYLNFSISDISGKEGITNDKLYIERVRYSKLPVEQRICRLYSSEVEDEFHCLKVGLKFALCSQLISPPNIIIILR
jgi:hypothetical protein